MIETIIASPLFGVLLSFLFFELGVAIQNRVKSSLANPLLISAILVMILLKTMGISYEEYNHGARFISMFLSPCTAVLSVNIYSNFDTLKKHFLPVFLGTAAASAASLACIYGMCRLFGLTDELLFSLLPKSVTSAIAMPLAAMTGGMESILIVAASLTGIFCAMAAPILIKLYRLKDPVAIGVAIGSSGHAIGTTLAIQLGPVQGAMSGIAIGMTGLLTVLYYAILF